MFHIGALGGMDVIRGNVFSLAGKKFGFWLGAPRFRRLWKSRRWQGIFIGLRFFPLILDEVSDSLVDRVQGERIS